MNDTIGASGEDKERRRILQYAMQKFATSGYSAVSIAQFASQLRMSKSTFYKYYSSKEKLLYAVIEDFYATFEQEIDAIEADRETAVTDKIRAFLLVVRRRFSTLQVSAVEDLQRAVPEAYELMEEKRKGIIAGKLVRLFEQGAAEGYFRGDVPPALLAGMLLSLLRQMEDPQYIGATSFSFPELFQHVFSVLMEGSLSERGRREWNGESQGRGGMNG